MHGEHDVGLMGELRQRAQVEVPTVKVVRVHDIGPYRWEIKQRARGREAELFATAVAIDCGTNTLALRRQLKGRWVIARRVPGSKP